MHRSSPPRIVPGFEKDEVGSAESVASATFVNLEASHVTHEDGFAHGVYAILPEKAEYDKLRFSFGVPTLAGTTPDFTLELWAKGSDGNAYLLGSSELSAAGTFPPIECENHQATYALVVAAVSGTNTPTVSVTCFVQGLFETVAVAG